MKLLGRLAALLAALLFGAGGAHAEGQRAVIPLTLTESAYGGGRIYVPVRFGHFLGAMRLDTGASSSRVAAAPWNKDLPSLGLSKSTGATGRTTSCEDVAAQNFGLKASEGTDIARAAYQVSRCALSDGDDLLGLDFFQNARFSLDFARREMVFFGEAIASGRPKAFRALGPEKRLLGVDLRAGGVAVVGLFDTGAEICAVDLAFVKKHKNLFTLAAKDARASEVGGKQFASKIYRIKELDLGDGRAARDLFVLAYDFAPLRAALGRDASFILGYNFLSRFAWDFDFRSGGAPSWDARPR